MTYRRQWVPPKKSRVLRRKEHIRFQTLRWRPELVHEPFSKRYRRKSKYAPKRIPRFIREHTNCGEVVLYSRFWVNRKHSERHLTHRQLHAWDVRRRFIRYFKPSLLSNDIVGVQPMEKPVGLVFSIRAIFSTPEELKNQPAGYPYECFASKKERLLEGLSDPMKKTLGKLMDAQHLQEEKTS